MIAGQQSYGLDDPRSIRHQEMFAGVLRSKQKESAKSKGADAGRGADHAEDEGEAKLNLATPDLRSVSDPRYT